MSFEKKSFKFFSCVSQGHVFLGDRLVSCRLFGQFVDWAIDKMIDWLIDWITVLPIDCLTDRNSD